MIYGVFSDVHANLEALEAVLERLEKAGAHGYICCGDLVGYGPNPEECLKRIRALKNLTIVCGNHDLAVVGRMDLAWFNPYARTAAIWTRAHLSQESRGFIEGLTARLETSDFTVAHGTPRKPPEEYLLSAAQFKDNISYVRAWPLFVGHSHMPLFFRAAPDCPGGVEQSFLEADQEVEVSRAPYGLVPTALNPGSVGQPRDQDPRAACALYDSGKGVFQSLRLSYDIPKVQAKIRQVGLPEYLALRLAYGQ